MYNKKDALQKINSTAKYCLDLAVDMPSRVLPDDAHMFITLATINYAKHWNSSDESKFTKYITMQFGYKDDSGKVWSIISKSIERALKVKNRFFLKITEEESSMKLCSFILLVLKILGTLSLICCLIS